MTVTSAECDLMPNVFHKGMQNPVFVLRDEESGNVVTELEDLSCVASEHNSCGPTAVNVENSKDVIIGPVTQFHGPVTIYHNFNGVPTEVSVAAENKTAIQNGKLVKSESTSSDSPPGVDKSNSNFLTCSKRLTCIAIAAVTTIIIVATLCSVMLPASKTEEQTISAMKDDKTAMDDDKTIYPQSNNAVLSPIEPGSLITREMWGAKINNHSQPLRHPTPLVIICHTASSQCKTYDQCVRKVANIRDHSVNSGMSDIKYNFLVGDDGYTYVGRGWDAQNEIAGNSVSIAFIGNYVNDPLPKNMSASAKNLIENGVKEGKLSKNYKVVCHNQTASTLSPGRYVYEEVKNWPNYDPSSYMRNKS